MHKMNLIPVLANRFSVAGLLVCMGAMQLGAQQLGTQQLGTQQLGTQQLGTQQLGEPSVYAAGGGISIASSASQVSLPGGDLASHESTNRWGDAERSTSPKSAPTGNFPAFSVDTSKASPRDESKKSVMAIPAITVTSSLAIVLGLFAVMVWAARKFGSNAIAPGAIPREVMETLGSTAIDTRTRMTMIRCGNKILVVAQTATGVTPISEITDPEDVRRLTAACLGDSKRSFASALKSIETEPAAHGFVEPTLTPAASTGSASTGSASTPRSRGRLFATA